MDEPSPSARGDATVADRARVARAMRLAPQERVLWASGPGALSVVARPLGWLLAITLMAWGGGLVLTRMGAPAGSRELIWGGAALIGIRLVWEVAVWASRSYALTDRRVLSRTGVFRRSTVELPLERVQVSAMYRAVRERALGLGTVGFASAGTGSYEVVWAMIPSPDEALALARQQIDARAGHRARGRDGPVSSGRRRPPIIGLTGGIGAGKSEVARILAERGCLVLDSDAQARIAIERDDVRDTLRSWWGDRVFDAQGRVDRSAVASIVFTDPAERSRLEALIHPIIAAGRKRAIAAAADVPAVVIDAPLLFEAGVDRECDAVIFVDAERDTRVRRVESSRGWSESELDRREAGQWPVARKRAQSRYHLTNDGSLDQLRAQTGRILDRILQDSGSKAGPGPIH